MKRNRGSKKVEFKDIEIYDDNDDDNNEKEAENDEEEIVIVDNERSKHAKRAASQFNVAHKRAGHFARMESKGSSTPTGSYRTSIDTTNQPTSWPGPFSTARDIMAKREIAKIAREEEILAREEGSITNLEEMDEYDKILNELKWLPKSKSFEYSGKMGLPIPSLSTLCTNVLVSLFDNIESIDCLSKEMVEPLAIELAKQRKLNSDTVLLFASTSSTWDSLVLPECSDLSDEKFSEIFARISNNERFLIELKLNNCGHGFTSKISKDILKGNYFQELQVLKLTGLYRLSDEFLVPLLDSAIKLTNLDLTCNSRIRKDCILSINKLKYLTSICFDQCSHLTDDIINHLGLISNNNDNEINELEIANILPLLSKLSLADLFEISDNSIIKLIKKFGNMLTYLNISGCLLLTDNVLIAIREHCNHLSHLNLADLVLLSSEALIGLFINNTEIIDSYNNAQIISVSSSSSSSSELITTSTSSIFNPIGVLQSINLQGIINVNDEVMLHLIESFKTTLINITITSCSNITSKTAVIILKNCYKILNTLEMSFVRGISEDSLGLLVDTCFNLRKLSVWGNSQLTAKFFEGHSNYELFVAGRSLI
jgi:DNA repair protein RAD7